jgi:hypothetical protein
LLSPSSETADAWQLLRLKLAGISRFTVLRWVNAAPYLALKWAAPAGTVSGHLTALAVTVPVPGPGCQLVHCARWTRGPGALPLNPPTSSQPQPEAPGGARDPECKFKLPARGRGGARSRGH